MSASGALKRPRRKPRVILLPRPPTSPKDLSASRFRSCEYQSGRAKAPPCEYREWPGASSAHSYVEADGATTGVYPKTSTLFLLYRRVYRERTRSLPNSLHLPRHLRTTPVRAPFLESPARHGCRPPFPSRAEGIAPCAPCREREYSECAAGTGFPTEAPPVPRRAVPRRSRDAAWHGRGFRGGLWYLAH